MQFQLTSELNAPIPTFTLTCTSTGGPATTVSWTSNNSIVTGDETHIIASLITNTTTATYNHKLMVTGRLVGDYECTVSNNKTSPSSGMVTVIGKNYKCTVIFVMLRVFTYTLPHTAYSMSITAIQISLHAVMLIQGA